MITEVDQAEEEVWTMVIIHQAHHTRVSGQPVTRDGAEKPSVSPRPRAKLEKNFNQTAIMPSYAHENHPGTLPQTTKPVSTMNDSIKHDQVRTPVPFWGQITWN